MNVLFGANDNTPIINKNILSILFFGFFFYFFPVALEYVLSSRLSYFATFDLAHYTSFLCNHFVNSIPLSPNYLSIQAEIILKINDPVCFDKISLPDLSIKSLNIEDSLNKCKHNSKFSETSLISHEKFIKYFFCSVVCLGTILILTSNN